MERKHAIIQYVRDRKGRPLGAIVAVKRKGGFMVGHSLCNRLDRFDRETALKIAFGRAESWEVVPGDLPKDIAKRLPAFIERCKKYYRTETEPQTENAVPF